MADRIEALSGDPRPRGCEKLTGGVRYRVRQGSYRVLYEVDDKDRVVTVVKIGHRSDGPASERQLAEARRRLAEHDIDPSTAIPWDEAEKKLRARK
jgi:hypothetical protein